MKRLLRNLILGPGQYIESYPEFKQVMLSGQFAVIGILVCLAEGVMEAFYGNLMPVAIFGGTIVLLIISIYYHRIGKHCRANYYLLAPVSITAYLMVSSEDVATGAFIYFVPISLGAFIIFGYRYRYASALFALMTFALFLLSSLLDVSILPYRSYTEEQMVLTRIINFGVAAVASVTAVYLLIRLNYRNSVQLIDNYRLLTKTNNELDRFVYSTSHDLRAPLTSILGLINIAALSDDPVTQKRYMSMMRDRIGILDKFIKDITDYSRNNRLAVDLHPIQLHSLIAEIWEMLRYTPEAQHMRFEIDIPTDIIIESDVNRLRTVLLNLITNAIRYHDSRKADKYIRLRYQASGKGFHIKVEDNGQGIDPVYHQRIFDMFFRANETSTGSGLGLYIVKETIAKLSGSIQLESSPGVGSVFTVKLPG